MNKSDKNFLWLLVSFISLIVQTDLTGIAAIIKFITLPCIIIVVAINIINTKK